MIDAANEFHFRVLVTVSIILGSIALASCCASNTSVEGLKEEIEKECPIGTRYENVLAYLDAKRIVHSPYQHAKLYDGSIDDYVWVWTIGAQIPRVERKLFTTWTIYLSFDFDDDGKLKDYKVRKAKDDP